MHVHTCAHAQAGQYKSDTSFNISSVQTKLTIASNHGYRRHFVKAKVTPLQFLVFHSFLFLFSLPVFLPIKPSVHAENALYH
jgi:hypothetical protein